MIAIKNLDFYYHRDRLIYKDLNLTLENGSVCGLLGLNGAGKTTLLNLIAGFLIPLKGSCKVNGQESSNRNPKMLEEIFAVSDNIEFSNQSIGDFRRLYAEFYPRFDLQLFNQCLTEFILFEQSSLKKLSFGDKKKVMLSFALATRCSILLLDEPTDGLDIPSKAIFRKLLASNFNENQIILIASHQIRDLADLFDRIIIERRGTIILNESIEHIAEKLSFGLNLEMIDPNDQIYVAESYNTNKTISINRTMEPTKVDIELLFNVAIKQPNEITRIFNLQNDQQ